MNIRRTAKTIFLASALLVGPLSFAVVAAKDDVPLSSDSRDGSAHASGPSGTPNNPVEPTKSRKTGGARHDSHEGDSNK